MAVLKLLSTDFDGTLIDACIEGPASSFPPKEKCHELLAIELEKTVAEGGIWAINTGRPLDLLLKGLDYLNAPVAPHYLITSERYIYSYDRSGKLEAVGDWNQRCDEEHEQLFKRAAAFMYQLHKLLAEYGSQVTLLENTQGIPEEILVSNEVLLDEIVIKILELPGRPLDFLFQRSHVHLHFCHGFYNKGSSLTELSRLLSIKRDHILAIGDYHNDITMLTEEVAGMVACPSNAHHKVKEAVQKARGHISEYPSSQGTAEAIYLYRENKKPRKNIEDALSRSKKYN